MLIVKHPTAVADARGLVTGLLILFFGCVAYLLPGMLRNTPRPARAVKPPVPAQNLEGTVYGLIPGRSYRIVQSFADCYSARFEAGETLVFRQRHFLPYHGGHTLEFEGRSIYLQETQNAEILGNFAQYIAPVP